MKQLASAAICAVSMSFAASGIVWNDWTGRGDPSRPFSDDGNWTHPVAGSRVQSFKHDLYVTNGTEAAALSTAEMWYQNSSGNVIWDLPTNSVLSLYWGSASSSCRLVKKNPTADLMLLVDYRDVWDYNGRFTVEEGVLRLPDYTRSSYSGAMPGSDLQPGFFAVSNGATLVLANVGTKALQHSFAEILSYGMVTNESAATHKLRVKTSESHPSRIYGPVGGNIEVVGLGSLYLYCPSNTFTSFSPDGDNPNLPTVIGLCKIGNTADLYSSMGYGTSKILSWSRAHNGVVFKYLGLGETTNRRFVYGLQDTWRSYPHKGGFDGGPNGGLVLSGVFENLSYKTTALISDALHEDLLLLGDHATPCVIDSTFNSMYSDATGRRLVTHFTKRGSGTWRFTHKYVSSQSGRVVGGGGFTGGISIEEGTIQADSYGEEGDFCALGGGLKYDQYGEYRGLHDESKRVPWVYSFGLTNAAGLAATEGTLESLSTNTALSCRRPFVLLGNGRLKATGSGRFCIRDIKPRSAGEKTLTLDGTNTLVNMASEISDDSVAGATISVVKEGSGRWVLNGNQTFHGDLSVRSGTLEVNANTNPFTWFRFTQQSDGNRIALSEIAVYDKDGYRQNKSITKPSGYPTVAKGGDKWFFFNDYADIAPGKCHVGRMCGYLMYNGNGPDKLFDGGASTATIYSDVSGTNNPSNALLSAAVVFRLAEGKKEIASYDLGAGDVANWASLHPRCWRLEGSRDGVSWEVLTNVVNFTDRPTANSLWYSDKASITSEEPRRLSDGKGFPVRGNSPVSSLENVRSVHVARGATLKTECANVAPISCLKVDVSGTGSIDGFAFAENGVIDIVSDGALQPGRIPFDISNSESAGNLANWTVKVNGERSQSFAFAVGPDGVSVYKRGCVLILR